MSFPVSSTSAAPCVLLACTEAKSEAPPLHTEQTFKCSLKRKAGVLEIGEAVSISLYAWDNSKRTCLSVLEGSRVIPLGGLPPVELLLLPKGAVPLPKTWASYRKDLGPDALKQSHVTRHFSPYDMTVSWRTLQQAMPDFAAFFAGRIQPDQRIYMESLYQALKIFAFTPANQRRTRFHAQKFFGERRLSGLDEVSARKLTGRQVLQLSGGYSPVDHLLDILLHPHYVRQHWHSRVVSFTLGSIDPWDLDKPLNGYGLARAVYVKIYRLYYRSNETACGLVRKMVRLALAGHPLVLVETDAFSQGGQADATLATLETLSSAAASCEGKLGHSMVLAWDLLHLCASAADISSTPLELPLLRIPDFHVGWKLQAADLSVGDIIKQSTALARGKRANGTRV
jgi:hypothetical protein